MLNGLPPENKLRKHALVEWEAGTTMPTPSQIWSLLRRARSDGIERHNTSRKTGPSGTQKRPRQITSGTFD